MHGNVHIRVEYPEAVESKKSMLLFEKSTLEVIKHARAYDSLRKREFNIKNQLKNDFAKVISLISEIEAHIPKEDASFTKEHYKKEEKIKSLQKQVQKKKIEQRRDEIQYQIDEIKSKLARLE
jgi:phage-related protein